MGLFSHKQPVKSSPYPTLSKDELGVIFSFLTEEDYPIFSQINSDCHSIVLKSDHWENIRRRKEEKERIEAPKRRKKVLCYVVPLSITIATYIIVLTIIFFFLISLYSAPLHQCTVSDCIGKVVNLTCKSGKKVVPCPDDKKQGLFIEMLVTMNNITLKTQEQYNSKTYNSTEVGKACNVKMFDNSSIPDYALRWGNQSAIIEMNSTALVDCYYHDSLFSLTFKLKSGWIGQSFWLYLFFGLFPATCILIIFLPMLIIFIRICIDMHIDPYMYYSK